MPSFRSSGSFGRASTGPDRINNQHVQPICRFLRLFLNNSLIDQINLNGYDFDRTSSQAFRPNPRIDLRVFMSNFSKWISYATILIASGCTAGGTLASKIPPRTPHRPVSITLPKPTAQATKPKVSTRPSRPSPPPSPQATPEASAKPERFEAEISDSQISDSQIFDSPAPPHDLVLDLPDSARK